jgi:outer membrane protein assembly factor BamB
MSKNQRFQRLAASISLTALCLATTVAMAQSTQPTTAPTTQFSPPTLPGNGLSQHPFLYAGEWDTRHPEAQSMFLVSGGKIVWQYSIPMKAERGGIQEFDDATLMPDGNIVFSRMSGAGIVSPEKKLVWEYKAPAGTEVHSAQFIGKDHVLIMRNGTPPEAMIFNIATDQVEKEIPIPTTIKPTHGQFRHIRMTPAGTILVPHMGEGKVVEYDQTGKEIWSVPAKSPWQALRLDNGDTLISGDAHSYVREVNPKGDTVWELTQADVPDIKLFNIQGAERLANGNTVICNWCPNGLKQKSLWPQTVQVLEVTPDKKVVWALRSWEAPADLGTATSIQLLDEPGAPAMHLAAQ